MQRPGDRGVHLDAPAQPAAERRPPPGPAERDPPVVRRARVVEEGAGVADGLAAPAERLDDVRHRFGDDEVADPTSTRPRMTDIRASAPPAASTACPARIRAPAVSTLTPATPSPRTRSTRACSCTTTPRSISLARRPSARRPGCTVAPSGAYTPRRKTGESQCSRTCAGVSSTSRSPTPSSSAARAEARPTSSCASVGRHPQLAPAPVPRVDALLVAPAPDRLGARLGRACELERRPRAEAVAQRVEAEPGAVAEAAVAAAGPVAAEIGLEQDDACVGRRLEEMPGAPHARVAAADHDDVGADVARPAAARRRS